MSQAMYMENINVCFRVSSINSKLCNESLEFIVWLYFYSEVNQFLGFK